MTEFSWDTNPPDPKGVPQRLHARWVSEALFRMWRAGVSAVIWFRLQDDPLRVSPYQSGFFTTNGQAKYSLEAFRFPFVAFEREGRRLGLGSDTLRQARRGDRGAQDREPLGRGQRVSVPTATASSPPASAAPPHGTTAFRARLAAPAELSIPFSLTVPPTRAVAPFGCGGSIRCPRG